MFAMQLVEQIESLAEGLRARPGAAAAHALAEDAQRLLERVQQLRQIEGSERESQRLRR